MDRSVSRVPAWRFSAALSLVFTAFGCLSAEAVDYKTQVRPLLENRCLECHGPEKQKGGLRLDRRRNLLQGGDSGQSAVVPGQSSGSLLFIKVSTNDPAHRMPPKGEPLSTGHIRILKDWIDSGAEMPRADEEERKHWAYLQPKRPAPPSVARTNWPINDIDRFVLSRLEKEGLPPSQEAERGTWLRRASLDLIGLPPTLKEVEAFLLDNRADAYAGAVDRLLASPHYGERWARPWLDLARYADTQGYEKDNRRSMWPYRDWVIQALNADMPFDQFTIEQIAGDLLTNATPAQRIATGFHRNTMTNTEGGTDNEEFRYEAIVDRVNTTYSAWMGTTMACAQCHNHKYDPFTAKDYFQSFAFLNNTADADADDESPTMKVFAPGQEAQLSRLQAEATAAEKTLNEAAARPEMLTAYTNWEQKAVAGISDWQVLDPVAFASLGGATFTKTESKSLQAQGPNASTDIYTVVATAPAQWITGIRLEVLEAGTNQALGRHEKGHFVLQEFSATAGRKPLTFIRATADYSQQGYDPTNLIAGTGHGWAVDAVNQRVRRSAYFTLAEPLELSGLTHITFTLRHSNVHPGANIARFRLSSTTNSQVGLPSNVPPEVRAILLTASEKRDEKQKTRLREYFQSIEPALQPLLSKFHQTRKAATEFEAEIPITSVMQEMPSEKTRKTRRHLRGSYLSPGEEVTPAVPVVLHPFRPEWPTNRLGFAYWLVDSNNPLTARVIMNRIWEQYFGRGLVESVEDFGSQGEPPSHPELLDFLATEFMQRGWSLKSMHKLIVLSATYRQNSRVTSELIAKDPYNRLLTRGPRVRLEAEMIRDQALAAAGLLSRKIGGPSVMPPQPDGLWQVVYSGDAWKTSPGEDKYRRGLYTFWRRSIPHPMMTMFDAPTREYCVLRRTRSNTPLQALNTMNDPAFVECAQALARRIVALPTRDPRQRAAQTFRICLARDPRPAELTRLVQLFNAELAQYEQDKAAAERMACSELGKPAGEGNLPELAAWTVVANVLMNLDEFLTKS